MYLLLQVIFILLVKDNLKRQRMSSDFDEEFEIEQTKSITKMVFMTILSIITIIIVIIIIN